VISANGVFGDPPGRLDHDVEPVKAIHDLIEQPHDRRARSEVTAHLGTHYSGLVELCDRSLDLSVVRAAGVERDRGAELPKGDRDAMSKLTARAGHQRHLPIESLATQHLGVRGRPSRLPLTLLSIL
jgi:hypothetical protein